MIFKKALEITNVKKIRNRQEKSDSKSKSAQSSWRWHFHTNQSTKLESSIFSQITF